MFANGGEYAALHPGDERPTWAFCVPRLEWDDEALTEIRAALLWRAEALGHMLDHEPDLHLVIDGKTLWPIRLDDDRAYRFEIPEGSREVLIASRTSVPAEIDAGSRDTRRLGVPLERVVLSDADARLELGHRHGALCDGFQGAEPGHRWSNGLGRLAESVLRVFDGPFTLDVHLAPSALRYRARPPMNHQTAA